MGLLSNKEFKNAVNITNIFLKVKGYIDEDGNPTDKAKGMLMKDADGDIAIVKPKGVEKLQKLINGNADILSKIARTPNVGEMTTDQVKFELINKGLLK